MHRSKTFNLGQGLSSPPVHPYSPGGAAKELKALPPQAFAPPDLGSSNCCQAESQTEIQKKKIEGIRREMGQVAVIMQDNLHKAMERGENLQDLSHRTGTKSDHDLLAHFFDDRGVISGSHAV
jgi:hypothetical protein